MITSIEKTERDIIQDWPVVRFRPEEIEPKYKNYSWVQLNENKKWSENDGQPAMAFVGRGDYPRALYVDIPCWQNILSAVRTDDGVWHYETRDGEPHRGGIYLGFEQHPNEVAGRKAMDHCANLYGAANGQGLKALPMLADVARCAYCAHNKYGHRVQNINCRISSNETNLEAAVERLAEAKSDVEHWEEVVATATLEAKELQNKLKALKSESSVRVN